MLVGSVFVVAPIMGGYRRGGIGSRHPTPSGKSQLAIGFLRNSGTDPYEKLLDPSGPMASRGGPYGSLCDTPEGIVLIRRCAMCVCGFVLHCGS